MSDVFYRKWRPQRLDQVVGQEPVTQTLRQAVSLGRVAHAYLFCGPRGTGKTSSARILAKAVNCMQPEAGEPDNVCEICRSVNEGRALDLIEIDAASNRGIDDIRNLSDKVRFTPNEARYKVYIIDEVHMLTEPAFNALLKTLEEPPAHAIFVLATTEPHKVPLTIISRCQRFDFRRIPLDSIVGKLLELCEAEQIEATREALALIARNSTGSLRDAENLLEQAVVSYGSPIGEDQVRDLLGLGSDEMALALAGHIVSKSVGDGLVVINQVAGQGNDLRQLHRGTMEYLRSILLLKSNAGTSLGYSEDITARLSLLAAGVSMGHLVGALKTVAKVDLRHDNSSPLPLELALVESSTDLPVPATAQLPAEVVPVQSRPPGPRVAGSPRPNTPAQKAPVRDRPPDTRPDVVSLPEETRTDSAVGTPLTGNAARLEQEWAGVIRSLRHTGKRFKLGALLRGSNEREVSNGRIILKFPYQSHVDRMQDELGDPETSREVLGVLAQVIGDLQDVQVSLASPDGRTTPRGAAQASHLVDTAQAFGARVVGEKEEET